MTVAEARPRFVLRPSAPRRRDAPGLLVVSELIAAALGFATVVLLAHRLGPGGFAGYEAAAAVAAWWLVVVRGGCDPIVYREAARRPRLIGPLTDTLLGLRLAGAAVGGVAVLLFAGSMGGAVAVAGLSLVASALAADVGPRARGRWGGLALVQVARSVVLLAGVAILVRPGGTALAAAGCLTGAEAVAALGLIAWHRAVQGAWPRPRFRPWAWRVLGGRGAVAALARFGRVTLYAADLMVLATVGAGPDVGSYAAARRVGFALLALGLVVPSTAAPALARAWAAGVGETRAAVAGAVRVILLAAVPVGLGLAVGPDRGMALLFGDRFPGGGWLLVLVAARLPFVLISNVQTVALVACRREGRALRLSLALLGLGGLALPVAARWGGAVAVAVAALGVEVAGMVGGGWELRRLGIAPTFGNVIAAKGRTEPC